MSFRVLERFLAFRRVPVKVVAITALTSYALQIGAIFQGQPLYIIAFYTLLPWIPLAVFEGLWKYEHYQWIAIFAVIAALQVGHLGEHTFQVAEYTFLNGTLECPPPVDNAANAKRAVDLGLRSPTDEPTFISAQVLQKPDGSGTAPQLGSDGRPIDGPPACGVFGQLDFETVHLVWDSLIWLFTLLLLMRFPSNRWLWVTAFFASAHEVEHLFISYAYFFERDAVFAHLTQLWATTVDGNIVTAHPAGQITELVPFYVAGGKQGIMGQSGLIEQLLGSQGRFPLRPFLHLGYNSLVVIPTCIAFLMQVRKVYDQYLAGVMPGLSEEQLVATTPKLEELSFPAGTTIIRQGDPADRFYIITRGTSEVVRSTPNGDVVTVQIAKGQYFGEIGLLEGGKRTATVRAATDVTALCLDRETFQTLMQGSEVSRQALERVAKARIGTAAD
ncbi:MAG TPA: cyclic nucleotide-binding domain-containing protein [Candidatus Limnocylindria bacterium]|nr:cyclic nucleotide-binding domain-containing protein [Candidatus Limnocylindria bacterium]